MTQPLTFSRSRRAGLIAAGLLGLLGCSSTGEQGGSNSATSSNGDREMSRSAASNNSRGLNNSRNSKPVYNGKKIYVTNIMVTNTDQAMAFLPQQLLADTLVDLEQMTQNKRAPVEVYTTYLSLLRLYGQNPGLILQVQKTGGSAGGLDDPWFCIEAGYAAMQRRDFLMADYLFGKARTATKKSRNPTVDSAIDYATGMRFWLLGERQTAIALMKKSTEGAAAYYPALVTLGFLALRSGDFKGAEGMFRKATGSAQSDDFARLGLAAALRVQGRESEAKGILEGLMERNKRDKRFVWNYVLSIKDSNPKGALKILDSFVDLEGVYPELDGKAAELYGKIVEQQSAAAAGKPTGG